MRSSLRRRMSPCAPACIHLGVDVCVNMCIGVLSISLCLSLTIRIGSRLHPRSIFPERSFFLWLSPMSLHDSVPPPSLFFCSRSVSLLSLSLSCSYPRSLFLSLAYPSLILSLSFCLFASFCVHLPLSVSIPARLVTSSSTLGFFFCISPALLKNIRRDVRRVCTYACPRVRVRMCLYLWVCVYVWMCGSVPPSHSVFLCLLPSIFVFFVYYVLVYVAFAVSVFVDLSLTRTLSFF